MPVYLDKNARAYKHFVNSLRSEHTKKAYLKGLTDFMEYAEILDLKTFLKARPRVLQDKLIDFVTSERERQSYASVSTKLAGVAKFCAQADIMGINFKKVQSFLGAHVKTVKDRTYTREEIAKLYGRACLRSKVILLILVSTGMRVGALPELRIRHLTKWPSEGLYQFAVYERSKEEYITFCTPECTKAIDEYVEYRRGAGEEIAPDSPLVRNEFDFRNEDSVKNVQVTTTASIRAQFIRLMDKAGVKPAKVTKARCEVMALHATRKFANTEMLRAGVNVVTKELLLGHSANLDDSYFRPTVAELLKEYMKVIPALTISDEERLKLKVGDLQNEVKSYKTLDIEMAQKDKVVREMQEAMQRLEAKVALMQKLQEKQ